MTAGPVGHVSALWRFPVKSMLGELVETVSITTRGVVGDRNFALIATETGKVVSAKNPNLWPEMFACRAEFVDEPQSGEVPPPVRITLADGTSVLSNASDVDDLLTKFFGRAVHLAQAAPEDFTIDQYHPDIEDADPGGHRDETVDSKLGAALFAGLGMPSPVAADSFLDLFPVSVLTTATLDYLTELQPESRFDARRFRMNVVVATEETGFVENGWLGRGLTIGDGVQLGVAMPDPRCVMTTLAQGELPKDNGVLRTLAQHNRLDVAGAKFPCCGVYAVVAAPGTIRTGDQVTLS